MPFERPLEVEGRLYQVLPPIHHGRFSTTMLPIKVVVLIPTLSYGRMVLRLMGHGTCAECLDQGLRFVLAWIITRHKAIWT